MKSRFLLVAALLVGLFTGCSNDDDGGVPQGGTVELRINISNPSIATRAYDDPGTFPGNDGDQESTSRIELDNFHVYTFSASGDLLSVTPVPSISGSPIVQTVKTQANVSQVYILGNYTGTYPTIGSLTELQKLVHDQEAILPDPTVAATKLIVVGYTKTITDPASTGAPYTAALTLSPLSTKFNVRVNDKRTTANYTLKDVSVLYSAAKSHLFAQPTDATNRPVDSDNKGLEYAISLPTEYKANALYYTSGPSSWPSYIDDQDEDDKNIYTYEGKSNLVRTWTNEASSGTEYMESTFYTYAPMRNATQGYDKPMIITLRAYKGTEGQADYQERFFSVDVPKELAAKNYNWISNGYCYNVTMNLNDDGGGTTDPEKEPVNLEVTITPAKWTIVTIEKPFD